MDETPTDMHLEELLTHWTTPTRSPAQRREDAKKRGCVVNEWDAGRMLRCGKPVVSEELFCKGHAS